MKVPLFVVEEHHEAFLVWQYAIKMKMISPEKNVLIHLDEHSDSDVPKFDYSIHDITDNFNKAIEFTYNQLNIANFIIPSFYLGIFDEFYNLRHKKKILSRKKNTKKSSSGRLIKKGG